MLPFTVELRMGASVYKQLVYSVHKAIVSSQLLPGDRFPSIRTLSQELRINPNTAQKVVTRLVDQGLLDVQPGIGTRVAGLPESSPKERSALLAQEVEQLVVEARRLSVTLEEVLRAVEHHWKRLSDIKPASEQARQVDVEATEE